MPNRHIVDLDWFRTRLSVAWGFEPGWDLSLEIPFDVKDVRAKYTLPDGTPFNNPVGDLHHRTETLDGIGDVRIMVTHHFPAVLTEGDMAHAGFGLSLPSGRVESDPYRLGDLGLKHQHIQFGSGTVDPLFHAGYGWTDGPWSLNFNAGVDASLYEGPRGYQAATIVNYSLGPSYALTDWLSTSVQYVGIYQSRAHWHGRVDPNSGYLLHGISFAFPIRLGANTLRPMVIRVVDLQVPEGDAFTMDWIFSLSFELKLGAPTKEAP